MSTGERTELTSSVGELRHVLMHLMHVRQLARLARAIQKPEPGSAMERRLTVIEMEDTVVTRNEVLDLLCGVSVEPEAEAPPPQRPDEGVDRRIQ